VAHLGVLKSMRKRQSLVTLATALLFLSPAMAEELPTIKVDTLAEPVFAARCWTTAIAPTADGSFDYIAEYYNYGSRFPNAAPEWVVLDLKSGKQKSVTDIPGYANSNYQISNQLRAANGRIFFSVYGNRINYYDPTERTIKTLGQLIPTPAGVGYSFFYRLSIGPDGKLYATTQSNNRKTALAQIDTETLEWKVWTDLGSDDRTENLTYGYYHAADPPWVYITVGQGEWRLVAVNLETGESRVLGEPAKWMELQPMGPAIRAGFVLEPDPSFDLGGKPSVYEGNLLHSTNGARKQFWWCHDGALYPANQGAEASVIPGTHYKDRWPAQAAAVALPEVEIGQLSGDGKANVRWHMPRSDASGEVQLKIDGVEPIDLESLTAIGGDLLLGSAKQYNGFFTYNMKTGETTTFGKHGPSRPATAVVDGKVYICGYPSSILYVYDPQQEWKTDVNPKQLGHFKGLTMTHYAYWLIPGPNNRLYFGGRCERGVTGSGLGWYDLSDGSFHGHHDGLNFLTPRGMRLIESQQRIVFSGELSDDPNAKTSKPEEAQLILFDMDLNEQKRLTVKPGLTNTGWLYPGLTETEIISCINDGKLQALYRYDVKQEKLLAWQDMTTPVSKISRQPGTENYWALLSGGVVGRLDPQTLTVTAVGKFSQPVGSLHWVGDELYGSAGSKLLRIDTAGMK